MKQANLTHLLGAALRKRYTLPEWAYFPEVRIPQGNTWRQADGLAVNCYPSRGLELHGFEIKASGPDLLAEIRNPAKADALGRHADRWWIVTSAELCAAHKDRIPPVWGVLTLNGKGSLKVAKRGDRLRPEPMSRELVAALLRRSLGAGKEALEAEYARGWREAYEHWESRQKGPTWQEHESVKTNLANLEDRVNEFQKASGIMIGDHWKCQRVGDALSRMLKREDARVAAKAGIQRMIDQLEKALHA